jgi:phosphate/sulfate permease
MTARERWQKAIASAFGIGALLTIVNMLFHRKFDEGAILSLVYGIGVGLIGVVLMFQAIRGTKRGVTADGENQMAAHVDQQPKQQLQTHAKSTKLWDRWYVRYLAAILVLAGAYFSYVLGAADKANGLGGYALIGVAFWALWQAREVSGIVLVLGGVYALITAEWSLYIPGAIILGAIIIALAIICRERRHPLY